MLRRWQFLAVLAACLIGTAIGARGITTLLQPSTQAAAQSGPAIASDQLNILPGQGSASTPKPNPATDALIQRAQLTVRRNPTSTDAFTSLAAAYAQKERETSDVTYYTLADKTLSTALKLDPTNYAAINYQAWVALGQHDFARAATLAKRAQQLNQFDSATYGTLGDAEANLGNYAAMGKSYQRMVDLKPSLASYNRASYTRWLYGDLRNAVRFMFLAIRAGNLEPENVAWCESQLGDDYFNDGFVVAAQQQYQLALRTFPHYARALAGLALVYDALGHPAKAVRFFQQAIAIVPLPQYVIGLGDLYTKQGNVKAAAREYALLQFINHIFTINHLQFGIDMALFDADHNRNLSEALRVARATSLTRHDILTMDTLAWVLYKNGRYNEAWQAEQQALRLGTRFAPYFFHAGMIQAKLGNVVEAQSYLSTAIMTNPHFNLLYAPVALAELKRVNAISTQGSAAGKP